MICPTAEPEIGLRYQPLILPRSHEIVFLLLIGMEVQKLLTQLCRKAGWGAPPRGQMRVRGAAPGMRGPGKSK